MIQLKDKTKVWLVCAIGMGLFQLVSNWQHPTIAVKRALFCTGALSTIAVVTQIKTQKES